MTGMLQRWGSYLHEMYQPLTRLIFSALSCSSAYLFVSRAATDTRPWSWGLWTLGTVTMLLILLYYRVCDEFKDYEIDLKYFPERPLPSGRIHFRDLHWLRGLSAGLAIVINLIWPAALLPFGLLMAQAFLMGKWFFIPAMARHRLWAFITHSPIAFFGYYYLCHLFLSEISTISPILFAGFVLWISLPGMTWEIARKTRAPENEAPGYQTYSDILGPRGATFLTLFLTALHVLCLVPLWPILAPPVGFALLGAALLYALVLVAFCFNLRLEHWLKPVSEVYILPTLIAFPISALL